LYHAKLAYFELLINNANEGAKLDPEALDRIELLAGLKGTDGKSSRAKSADKNLSEPPTAVPDDPE
jgi:hypothetical protein